MTDDAAHVPASASGANDGVGSSMTEAVPVTGPAAAYNLTSMLAEWPEMLPTAAGGFVNIRECVEGSQIVALLFAESVLQASKAAIADLKQLQAQVATAGGNLLVVLVCQDEMGVTTTMDVPDTWPVVPKNTAAELAAWRLTEMVVALIPCLAFVDSRSGVVISTDGLPAMRRKSVTAANFPNWRTNCLLVRTLTELVDTDSLALHPDSLIRSGCYPGDVVTLTYRTRSVALYANAPHIDVITTSLAAETVGISPAVARQLKVVDGCRVVLEYQRDVPEAKSVTVKIPRGANPDPVLQGLRNRFGVSQALSEDEQSAMDQLKAMGIDCTDIEQSRARSLCRHTPVATGHPLELADGTQVSISSTEPSGTVIVGVDTNLIVANEP